MRPKRLIIFSIIFVLLAILALWKQGFWQSGEQESEHLFPRFKVEQALKIETKKEDKQVSLIKEEGRWRVASRDNYPASRDLVEDLLLKVETLQVDRVASRQEEKYSQFEVDEKSGLEVKVYGKEQEPLAHFYLGKQSPDYMSTYLRQEGQKEVLAVREALAAFSHPDWRERRVFTCKVEDVKKLTLSYPDKEIILAQEPEKGWQVVAPQPGEAKAEEVTKLFSALMALRIVRFVEDKPPKGEETGLAEPSLKVGCQLEEGRQDLLLGKLQGGMRYAKWEQEEFIYLLPENRLKPLWEELDLSKPGQVPPEQKAESPKQSAAPGASKQAVAEKKLAPEE